ncbi:MAG: DUF5117 domain-containing protein [bacterium]|nr:DUF5117 domain-containing protein [bacterium]
MLKRIHWIALIAIIALGTWSPAAFSDDDSGKATEEIKASTSVSAEEGETEVNVDVDVEAKGGSGGKTKTKSSEDTNNSIDSLDIENSGIQFNFINSNVTINGGTIKAEMNSGAKAKAEEQKKPAPGGKPGGGSSQKPEKPEAYDEAIKDATKTEGLFDVFTKEDHSVLWEVDENQLGKNFLLTAKFATGLGEGSMLKPGTYLGAPYINGGNIIYFKSHDKNIEIYERNMRYNAPKDSTEQRVLDLQYRDSLIAALPYSATNPKTGGYLVDMTKILLADYFQVNDYLRSSAGAGYALDRQNSYIMETKTFPENVVTRTLYQYRTGAPVDVMSVPDGRSVPVEILFNVQPLKDNPQFAARQPDHRIGYFLQAQINFDNDQEQTYWDRYISKWDLRKATPSAEMSPPVKPVVMWLQNTMPEKYRKPVRDAILEWNKAFEKVGIKGAIVVKEQPDDADWDAADSRYNVVHWNESLSGGYSGMAQWAADPRDGEILSGGFLLEGESVRSLLKLRGVEEINPVNQLKEKMQDDRWLKPNHEQHRLDANAAYQPMCSYGRELAEQYTDALLMEAADEGGMPDQKTLDKYVYQYLFSVAVHEMGHVLGLRHNFKGSTLLSLDQTQNTAVTQKLSLSSSVMDYLPINFAPNGETQGDYSEPTIGPYDYLAIEYGYITVPGEAKTVSASASAVCDSATCATAASMSGSAVECATCESATECCESCPMKADGKNADAILSSIGEKAELNQYAFGTDEEADYIDPFIQRFDLSNNPLAFAKQQAEKAIDTIPKLPGIVKEGDDYSIVRYGLSRMLNKYFYTADYALIYIGGTHINKVKKGGENDDKLPLDPVSAAKQREALDYIVTKLFSNDVFNVDPQVLQRIDNINWFHWGSFNDVVGDYPIVYAANYFYDYILFRLFSPATIENILDNEKQTDAKAIKFTLPELFRTVENGVWSEVKSFKADEVTNQISNQNPLISANRRALQRLHLKAMIGLALEPYSGTPEDARTLAWGVLQRLSEDLQDALDRARQGDADLDDYTSAHLSESLTKIKRALDADLNVGVDFW